MGRSLQLLTQVGSSQFSKCVSLPSLSSSSSAPSLWTLTSTRKNAKRNAVVSLRDSPRRTYYYHKREAEAEVEPSAVAEPVADADADAVYGYYGHGLGYTYGYPLSYAGSFYGHGLGYGHGYGY